MMKNNHPLDKLDDIFSRCVVWAEKLDNKDLVEVLSVESQRFKDRLFYVVITGECSKGKSSLLNAFLNEPNLCPEDAPSTTNNLTLIRWKETEQILVHFLENGQSSVVEISRDQIEKFVTVQHEKEGDRKVQLLEINLPNPFLKDGLVLIDTPGLGTQDAMHSATTFSILPNADGAIFVSDAFSELTQEELDFAKKLHELLSKDVIMHVLTKIDKQREWKKILDINKHHLNEVLNLIEEDILTTGISNKLKWDYIKTKNDVFLEKSQFLIFEQLIKKILSRSEIILGEKAKKIIQNACNTLIEPLNLEKFSLTTDSKEKIEEIEKKIQKEIDRLEILSDSLPIWQLELNNDFRELRAETFTKLNKDFQALRSKIEITYLDDNAFLNNLNQLENRIASDLGSMSAGYPKFIQEKCDRIYQKLIEKTELNLGTPYVIEGNSIEPGKTGNVQAGWGETMLIRGRTIGITTLAGTAGLGTVGAIIGGVIGTFAAPGAGTVAGATVGAKLGVAIGSVIGPIVGLFQGAKKVKERKKEKILGALIPILQDYNLTLQNELSKVINEYEVSIQKTFLMEVKMAIKNCKRNSDSLNSAKSKSTAEVRPRLAKIDAFIGALNIIKGEADHALEELKGEREAPIDG